jgi:hypothetical protein
LRVDLHVTGPIRSCALAARQLGIDRIGVSGEEKVANVIYRLPPTTKPSYSLPHIVVTGNIDLAHDADLVTITSFRMKDKLKKRIRKGLGVEFLTNRVRLLDGAGVAKWLEELREAYGFCRSAGCQLVLSSGATAPNEMVSGACYDEILAEINIEPQKYWLDLNKWLDTVLAGKVIAK